MKAIQITLIQICVILLVGIQSTAHAQEHHIVYTASFTKTLQKAGVELYEPVEQWLHVVPEREDGLMDCDLVLQNDRNDFEVRYRIRRKRGKWKGIPNNVETGRLISNIASNNPDAHVAVQIPDSIFLDSTFNADQGMFARFIPKMDFSEKPYGTYISLYSDEHAAVDVILLYYDPEYSAFDTFRHLRFK